MSQTKNWDEKVDQVVARTAHTISKAIDRMIADLPEGAAPQMATELLVRDLVPLQTWVMCLMMEDQYIRESYASEVSRLPATAKRRI